MTACLPGSEQFKYPNGSTALRLAAQSVVSQLLAAGADPSSVDEDSKNALQVASTGEAKALVRDLTTSSGEDEIEID